MNKGRLSDMNKGRLLDVNKGRSSRSRQGVPRFAGCPDHLEQLKKGRLSEMNKGR